MDLGKKIMTILFSQFREQSPWLTADDLRYRLKETGAGDVSIDALSREIENLKRQGYLEFRAVDPASLSRGFITRLTVPGRNLWVHGHSLTGS
jgi:hypothetical protein